MKTSLHNLFNRFTLKRNSGKDEIINGLIGSNNKEVPNFISSSLKYLSNLKGIPGTTFKLNGNELLVSIQGINYAISTHEEIFILNEIFVTGAYNFECRGPSIVVDIGMNVGLSSLFFAAKNNILKVIGYEPFRPTYERALSNFELNPSLANKIDTINMGMSNKNVTNTFDYYEDQKGSVSITDDPHFNFKSSIRTRKEEVKIVSADEQFRNIQRNYPNYNLICKIDCEGSEYDIFNSLHNLQRDQLPNVFMVEWHYKGNREIIDFLLSYDYIVFSFPFQSNDLGMIYASKNIN